MNRPHGTGQPGPGMLLPPPPGTFESLRGLGGHTHIPTPTHTLEHPRFTVEHHGRIVTGRQLLRNRRELVVQLVHPFRLLHSSLLMPDWMALCGRNLEGAYGDEKRALLLPALVPTIQPDDSPLDESRIFMAHLDRAVAEALREHPATAALPPLHPARFHGTVRWLHANTTLPNVRFAPPSFDKELEWQFLLLLHHGAKGHFHRFEELGNWEGN